MAAPAHHSADRDDESSPAPPRGCERHAGRAWCRRRRGRGPVARTADARRATRTSRRRRCTDCGAGLHSRARGGVPARRDRARPDPRLGADVRRGVRLVGCGAARRSTAAMRSRASRGGTSKGTVRPTRVPREMGRADTRRRARRVRWHPAVRIGPIRPPAPLPAPRLLGPFDPLLLGWVSRDPFVGRTPS